MGHYFLGNFCALTHTQGCAYTVKPRFYIFMGTASEWQCKIQETLFLWVFGWEHTKKCVELQKHKILECKLVSCGIYILMI